MVRVPFVVVLLVAPAFAQPKAPAGKVPTRAVPCAMDDLELFAAGDDPVACWDKGCMKLDVSRAEATMVAKPAAPKRWTIPQAEVKDGQVCLGTSCKPFGKKLGQAIADYKKDGDAASWRLGATADLKAVMFGESDVWSVAADRKLTIAKPPRDRKDPNVPNIIGFTPVGNLIVLYWSACAGPCTQYSIVDSAGQPKNVHGAGGGGVFQLDAKRFVVMSEYGALAVHELGTGRRLSSFDLAAEPMRLDAVRVDDETVFVLTEKAHGRLLSKVTLPSDKQSRPHVLESMYLPACTP